MAFSRTWLLFLPTDGHVEQSIALKVPALCQGTTRAAGSEIRVSRGQCDEPASNERAGTCVACVKSILWGELANQRGFSRHEQQMSFRVAQQVRNAVANRPLTRAESIHIEAWSCVT